MTSTLLDTKLYAPRRPKGLVSRPHLTDRVQRGTQSKLTLVSAPAGFGKSTLLAEWLGVAPADRSVTAWLSLDPGDNHPVAFWTHVIAALRTVAPTVGAKALTLLESPDRSIEAVLAPLLNELNALPDDIVLVLDDYHAIEAPEIQVGMAFLLEHLPAQVHLVIASRPSSGRQAGGPVRPSGPPAPAPIARQWEARQGARRPAPSQRGARCPRRPHTGAKRFVSPPRRGSRSPFC